MILCDECDYGYHITCLNPPLESVPEDDEWYVLETVKLKGELFVYFECLVFTLTTKVSSRKAR